MSGAEETAPPPSVELIEVSPRDGLQDEPVHLPTESKVALIERALDAGVTRVEAVSFVRPDRVPAMADAEEVIAGVSRRTGSRLAGLVLNERGLERALSAGVDEVNVVVPVSETFSRRNQGMGVEDAVAMWTRVALEATAAGVGASATLAVAFGCPYEGVVAPNRVRELARRLAATGASRWAWPTPSAAPSLRRSSCWCGTWPPTPGCR